MRPETLLSCAQSFSSLIGTQYIFHIGRSGKLASFEIMIEAEDFYHLSGLHYLTDRPDRRSRSRIFNSISLSAEYRNYLTSSEHWTDDIENRVLCTTLLSKILDSNSTIIHFNPNRLHFYSEIKADYLISSNEI